MVFTLSCEILHGVRRINRAYEVYAPGVKLLDQRWGTRGLRSQKVQPLHDPN